jgi:hypothetical protein
MGSEIPKKAYNQPNTSQEQQHSSLKTEKVRSSNLRGPIFIFNDSDDNSVISSFERQKHTYKIVFYDSLDKCVNGNYYDSIGLLDN